MDQILMPHPQQQALSEKQSLAFVQVFLNSSLACICHTRELIPWISECFKTRYIDQLALDSKRDGDEDLYHAFCETEPPSQNHSQEVRVFVRSQEARANSILDMIELGVFEAVQRKYLDALQVFILRDPNDPTSVLESYTFSFAYDREHLSIQLDGNKPVSSAGDVQKSFRLAIRGLLRSLKGLPALPRCRSLGMSLIYKEECPLLYQPEGFVDPKEKESSEHHLWNAIWDERLRPIGNFASSHHRITFATRSLTEHDHLGSMPKQDTAMSKQLQDMQKTSSRNNDLMSTLPGTSSKRRLEDVPQVTQSGSKRSRIYDQVKRDLSQSKLRLSSTPKPRVSGFGSDTSPADHDAVPPTKVKISKSTTNHLRGVSAVSRSRRRRNVHPRKIAEVLVHGIVIHKSRPETATEIFDEDLLEENRLKRVERGPETQCECRSTHVDDNMLFCELCGTWQHIPCYGYDEIRSGALPEEHLCYKCLLLPAEYELNARMPSLVRMRLALQFISRQQTSEIKVDADLRKAVCGNMAEVNEEFTSTIVDLVQRGLLTQPVDGIAHTRQVASDLMKEMLNNYVDPTAAIAHHYDTVRDGDNDEKRRKAIKQALLKYSRGLNYARAEGCIALARRDADGKEVIRYGYYEEPEEEQDIEDSVEEPPPVEESQSRPSARQRKLSVSERMVNINRSTPASGMSYDDAVDEAINEAEWEMRRSDRGSSTATGDSTYSPYK